MKGKYSALTVAKWFLWYNDKILEEEDADLISNLKLQKLLYYAQGCYLALKNEPLFNEQIVNWAHGPVVEEIYHKYKNNGSNGIEYQGDYDSSIDKDTTAIVILPVGASVDVLIDPSEPACTDEPSVSKGVFGIIPKSISSFFL